tara:strand:- start:34 stop:267 length:234 start_codon:yes stop_codon:yes gene_type:complete
MKFLVEWNKDAYGKTEPKIVTMSEFVADGIEGDWGIDEDGDGGGLTIENLENLEVSESLKTFAPYGWSIKVTKQEQD